MVEDAIVYDVVGIGNAIIDVLAKVGDGFLAERNLPKGEMTLLEAKTAGEIYNDIVPEREGLASSVCEPTRLLSLFQRLLSRWF